MRSVGTRAEVMAEPFSGLEVATVSADTLRAGIRVHGALESHTVALLCSVLRTHMRAGRRYLRVDLTDAAIAGPEVVDTLAESHAAVVALGGMLVFENAGPHVVEAVRTASLFVRPAEA